MTILYVQHDYAVFGCNGLINQDTSKDRFIMSLEVKYEQSNQTKKT
jgi:hypothetical protein